MNTVKAHLMNIAATVAANAAMMPLEVARSIKKDATDALAIIVAGEAMGTVAVNATGSITGGTGIAIDAAGNVTSADNASATDTPPKGAETPPTGESSQSATLSGSGDAGTDATEKAA